MRRLLPYWLVILSITLVLIYTVNHRADSEYAAARQEFIDVSTTETKAALEQLNFSSRILGENIRTIAALPSIRSINLPGKDVSAEAKVVLQRLYRNIASNIALTDIYIVAIDHEPGRTDPLLPGSELPILMLHELFPEVDADISLGQKKTLPEAVNSAPATGRRQINPHEHQQLWETAEWLMQKYPTLQHFNNAELPLVGGLEVPISETRDLIPTGKNEDQKGIVFSTPFYGMDGKFKGLVSAVILSSALRDLMPNGNLVLVNPGYGYFNFGQSARGPEGSEPWIRKAEPDPELIYSEALPLAIDDMRSPWLVWSGRANSELELSDEVQSITFHKQASIATLLLVALAAAASISFVLLNLDRTMALSDSLLKSRDAAQLSEYETHLASTNLKELNDDITVLNIRLTNQTEELRGAQTESLRKAKMAQLGHLVATVAHELRNPLGAARTTLFVLKKRLRGTGIDVTTQLSRLDTSIMRCDSIITELLDFSRANKPVLKSEDFDAWLEQLLHEEAARLPAELTLNCELGLNSQLVEFDASRMTRVMVNLLSNAAEAMLPSGKQAPEMQGRRPVADVSTSLTGRGLEISGKDNGPGIAPDMIQKIREPLFTTKGFGVGLGISAVEKILELHGGGLDVDSIQGKGARFIAWFPLSQTGAEAA